MRHKKALALILSLCLIFTTGCGLVDSLAGEIEEAITLFAQSAEDILPDGSSAISQAFGGAEGEYFEHIERQETDFEDMEYTPYDEADFTVLCDKLYSIAELGAGPEETLDTISALYTELCFLFTMTELAAIEYYSDPTDQKWEEEMNCSSELYFRLNDEYMYALGALAASEHSELLEDIFYESDVEYLAEYYGEKIPESDTQAQMDMYSEENRLIAEYYELMSEDEPDGEAVAELFVELVKLRQEEALWYGYEGYAQYAYESFYYRDYTPSDAEDLWNGVKENFAGVSEDFYWATYDIEDAVIESGTAEPTTEAILGALERNLPKLSSELSKAFDYMKRNHLYDIDYSAQKANMGYTTRLYYYDVPFIFNAPYGYFADYLDMIHEFGHFANAFYTWSDLVMGMADNDLAELQSQGLEVIFTAFYGDIFGSQAENVEDYLLMDMVLSVVDGAMHDEFQQRVYAEENLTAERVCEIYAEVYEAYGYEPYDGYEYEWIYVVHNFEYPFYYISYAVSALSALELYALMQTDFDAAVEKYLRICAMDTEYYYFSEALEETGFSNIFDKELCPRLAEDILKKLES